MMTALVIVLAIWLGVGAFLAWITITGTPYPKDPAEKLYITLNSLTWPVFLLVALVAAIVNLLRRIYLGK